MTCDNGPLRHKHHIVPRYKGGSDAPENLVEVSITQHAMYHYCNYQLWNNVEDYVAWRGLSGQISEQEFLIERQKIFAQKGNEVLRLKKQADPEFTKKMERKRLKTWNKNREKHLRKLRKAQMLAVEAARTPEAIEKKKKSFKQINHQQGEKNSQYGTRWIHNKQVRISKRIKVTDPLPLGWSEGRVINFDKEIQQMRKRENKKIRTKIKKEEEKQKKIKLYIDWYEIYCKVDFKTFCQITGYNKSQQNLCSKFQIFVSDYNPKAKNGR